MPQLYIRHILFCFFSLSLLGCGTTKLMDTWQAPEFHRADMKQVLVVAATSNTTNRVIFESVFAAELEKHGIKSIPSIKAIGDAAPTKEAVLDFLKQGKVDHVVAVQVGAYDIQVDRVPESVMSYYTGGYYPSSLGGYWGGYGMMGNTVTMTRESYIDTQTNVILTTSVYDAKTEQLAWGGRSKSFDVAAVSQVANELAAQMIRNMSN